MFRVRLHWLQRRRPTYEPPDMVRVVQVAVAMMTECALAEVDSPVIDMTEWLSMPEPEQAAVAGILLGVMENVLQIAENGDDQFARADWLAIMAAQLTAKAMAA